MKYLSAAIAFPLIFLVSCDSKTDSKESLAAPSPSSTAAPDIPANVDSAAAFKAGVTLNPQHGQPGHRCDIAVGAPLNAPATSIQPNASSTISPVTTTAATTNTNTDVQKVSTQSNASTTALNPKHGEPGHRCDIAVGAPLNSNPGQ